MKKLILTGGNCIKLLLTGVEGSGAVVDLMPRQKEHFVIKGGKPEDGVGRREMV